MEFLKLLLCCATLCSSLRTSHREYSFFHVIKDGETAYKIPEAQGVIKLSQLHLARKINRIINCFHIVEKVRNIFRSFNETGSTLDEITLNSLNDSKINSIWDVLLNEEEMLKKHRKSFDYPEFNTYLIQDTQRRERMSIEWEDKYRRSVYPIQPQFNNTLQLNLANQIDNIRKEVWFTSKTEWDFIYGSRDNELPAGWILHLWKLQTAYAEIIKTSLNFELQDHTGKLINHLMKQLSNFNSYIKELHTTLYLSSHIIKLSNSNNTSKLNPQLKHIINNRFGFEHGDIIYTKINKRNADNLEVLLSAYKTVSLQLRQLVPKFDMNYFSNSVRFGHTIQEHFAVQKETVFAIEENIYHKARKTGKIKEGDLKIVQYYNCQATLLLTGYENHCIPTELKVLKGRKECREDFCLLSNANCPKNINQIWKEGESVCTITSANIPFETSIIASSEESYDH